MDFWHVAAALVSAALHAGWNAALKVQARPAEVMTGQMLVGAILAAPVLVWTGLPSQSSWAWLAGSTICNMVTVVALLRAYELVGFGMAYPVIRALAVLLVVPAASMLSGEYLSLAGVAGIVLMVASLAALAADHVRGPAVGRQALGWIGVAGVGTAAYVLCDAQGVRAAGAPLAYGVLAAMCNAVAMSVMQRARLGSWRVSRESFAAAVPIALASMASYLLILWVWTGAPIAPAAALRDTSAVFAILIAVIWLKEPFTPFRLGAVALSAAAVPLLRFA
jgi:multidrug transporter EmrE-like cation transporter